MAFVNYTIEDLVRKYVNFSGHASKEAWHSTYCEFCGDGSRKRGPRGGWRFSDNGDSAFYHCFNCGGEGSFVLNREHPFSKDMRKILDSFSIPSKEYNALLLTKKDSSTQKTVVKKSVYPSSIEIPDYFIKVDESTASVKQTVRDFLKTNYKLSPESYGFYYCNGLTKAVDPKNKAIARALAGRLVIPFWFNGKMIYFQARDMTGKSSEKYISAAAPKNNILFNMDELFKYTDDPLYVVEGPMDAIHLNGVATLGNEITSTQREMLAKCKRQKILVPDFFGDNNKLANQFIENGWDISFPEYRYKCKDVSAAIVKKGKLVVAKDIRDNIKSSREANILLQLLKK